MFYKEIEQLAPQDFKRCTGVKKEVFALMLAVVNNHKQSHRKHPSRGIAPKLGNADKLLIMLLYYGEYRTQFHIGLSYGISESRVCEIIQETEALLIKDKRFHLPGKKVLPEMGNNFEVVLLGATESPIERPKKSNEKIIRVKRKGTPIRHK